MYETLQDLATAGRIAGQVAQALARQPLFWMFASVGGFVVSMNFFMAAM